MSHYPYTIVYPCPILSPNPMPLCHRIPYTTGPGRDGVEDRILLLQLVGLVQALAVARGHPILVGKAAHSGHGLEGLHCHLAGVGQRLLHLWSQALGTAMSPQGWQVGNGVQGGGRGHMEGMVDTGRG